MTQHDPQYPSLRTTAADTQHVRGSSPNPQLRQLAFGLAKRWKFDADAARAQSLTAFLMEFPENTGGEEEMCRTFEAALELRRLTIALCSGEDLGRYDLGVVSFDDPEPLLDMRPRWFRFVHALYQALHDPICFALGCAAVLGVMALLSMGGQR